MIPATARKSDTFRRNRSLLLKRDLVRVGQDSGIDGECAGHPVRFGKPAGIGFKASVERRTSTWM